MDYDAPLRHLRSAHPAPPEVRLPFSPARIKFLKLSLGSNVILRGDQIGYSLNFAGATTPTGHLEHPLKIDWDIGMKLSSLGGGGTAEKHLHLGMVRNGKRILLAFKAAPGLYRMDLRFERGRRSLGAYSEFFRVVRRRLDVGIALTASQLLPGETAFARVENRGTVPLLLPNEGELTVEHEINGSWLEVPTRPPGSYVAGTAEGLLGGFATSCFSFQVPSDASPGTYRFSTTVEANRGKKRLLTAGFSVGS